MKLFTHEPTDFSDEQLALEIATAILTIECGFDAVSTGDYEAVTKERVKAKAAAVLEGRSARDLFAGFRAWRDYGILGKYQDGIPTPHDGYALVLMSSPGVELYDSSHADNCSAVLQGMVAREKIDLARGRPTPGFVAEGWFREFSVGGSHSGLTVFELSLLARISIQGVRNELQKPGAPKAQKADSGLVTVDPLEAHQWLMGRRGFTDTYSIATDEEGLLVPIAKDGSIFDTSCRQGAGYKIGKKGEERYVEIYTEALDFLVNMPKAYWRRPSPTSGVPGIVSASSWARKTRKELGLD